MDDEEGSGHCPPYRQPVLDSLEVFIDYHSIFLPTSLDWNYSERVMEGNNRKALTPRLSYSCREYRTMDSSNALLESNKKPDNKKAIKIIVADDHPVVLVGLRKILEENSQTKLIAEETSPLSLLNSLSKRECDVLICDYSFGDSNAPDGLELIKKIRRSWPNIKIIILTSYQDLSIVQQTMRLGVSGFICKASKNFESLPDVIQRVNRGEHYLDAETMKFSFDFSLGLPFQKTGSDISAKELEVSRLFARGLSLTRIASKTNRSLKTVSTQKRSAMKKLGVQNDIEFIDAIRRSL